MQRHTVIQCILGFAACLVAGLMLLLWRLGLKPIWAGLVGMNVVVLLLYGYDKRQAGVGGTRIPEAALHFGALLGGTPGAILGQQLFRHKTRKSSFRLIFAAILLLQAALVYAYWHFVHQSSP